MHVCVCIVMKIIISHHSQIANAANDLVASYRRNSSTDPTCFLVGCEQTTDSYSGSQKRHSPPRYTSKSNSIHTKPTTKYRFIFTNECTMWMPLSRPTTQRLHSDHVDGESTSFRINQRRNHCRKFRRLAPYGAK